VTHKKLIKLVGKVFTIRNKISKNTLQTRKAIINYSKRTNVEFIANEFTEKSISEDINPLNDIFSTREKSRIFELYPIDSKRLIDKSYHNLRSEHNFDSQKRFFII